MSEQTPMPPDVVLQEMAGIFGTLADPSRLKILFMLCGERGQAEHNVQELADALGLSRPLVSRHLAYLLRWGVVLHQRRGTSLYYQVLQPAACDMIQTLHGWMTSPQDLFDK